MTTYKVLPKSSSPAAASCGCESPPPADPCWHLPPSCTRYPAVIAMPEDMVDKDCVRRPGYCMGMSVCLASPFYWWWPS